MNEYFSIIVLPVVAGILLFLVPDKIKTAKGIFSLLISAFTFWLAFKIYNFDEAKLDLKALLPASLIPASLSPGISSFFAFRCDNLAKLIILFVSLFTFLILLYSLVYVRGGRIKNYYEYFMLTLGCSYGAVLSDNLLIFLTFWGILGITLYKLIQGNNEESSATAKKTLILIGASDSIMIIGIAILWKMTGFINMSEIQVPTGTALSCTAFLALLIGSFTKAGAFPFHTWVPDYAKDAPASSSAYLPASLDKLLGIYFLARIVTGLFIPGEWMTLLLLTLGVATIITAVMMALIQHNFKQLLGYHAVSQVGYMILGLSLGSFIGIAAGLFHMVNHALYKSGLFLSAGAVEHRTGKNDLEDVGGLSKAMPLTFFAALICAMSISGIPPLNGFASKWMIYQAIIDFGGGDGLPQKLWVLWLVLAVLGSALTLASFIKFIGGIFLGRRKPEFESVKEVPAPMWIPFTVIALLCIIFGVFATRLVVPHLLMPVTGEFEFSGFWNSGFVSLLVLVSIVAGALIYLATGIKKFRTSDSFIGGEKFYEQTAYPAPEFYKTLLEFRFLSSIYRKAQEKWFDIYDLSKKAVLWCSHVLSNAHTGVLSVYSIWVIAGLLIMLLIMI
ncbi:MAG TPA: proton-conducting transporter membrane subunit [Bacteroidales bacterium]|nr:proton-conducting transporter membrane subunit [Bacteroidales bacterium]HOK75261.1 proton-conducting transporter membrane subunit [Bacteroidales bacterium]HOM41286.1 proton-conducting transporter membrane subunit [Bacteroidales bacterium]HPP93164.1 proton-conducting transporter membrane subunit [Bacteroidales bacterium]HRR16279.1 proton-conducting transporter membrane subunit [Bacteroidales bacterium]